MPRNTQVVSAMSAIAILSTTVSASLVMPLGGGWQATILDPDRVSLMVTGVSLEDNVLSLRKVATFDSIDPFTGQPSAAVIVFSQIDPDASTVSRIVIDDEFILNDTGLAWSGFRNELLGSAAAFDPVASAGFSIAPFTASQYSPMLDQVTFSSGLIPAGGVWTPGLASGGLWISVDLSAATPVSFVLKEIPQVPGPATAAVLGAAVTISRRRRRT